MSPLSICTVTVKERVKSDIQHVMPIILLLILIISAIYICTEVNARSGRTQHTIYEYYKYTQTIKLLQTQLNYTTKFMYCTKSIIVWSLRTWHCNDANTNLHVLIRTILSHVRAFSDCHTRPVC